MSDFIYTLDSDDEQPQTRQVQSTSTSKSGSAVAKRSQKATAKLTRKQQLAQSVKSQKAGKKQKQKRTLIDQTLDQDAHDSDDDDDDDDDNRNAQDSNADKDGPQINSDFVFDGLGGGFVGDRRNTVWDGGESYLVKRPNAIPRVTVDEIIARRAPERQARLDRLAADQDGEQDEMDPLEQEMLDDLEDDSGDDDDVQDDLDEEDDDDEGDEDEDEAEDEAEDEEADWLGLETTAPDDSDASKEDGESESDEEDTAKLEDADDDDDDDDEEEQDNDGSSAASSKPKSADSKVVSGGKENDGPTGFAALAELDAEMSDAVSDDSDDEARDRPASPSAHDGVSAADAAAAKAYFTSHSNSTSTSVVTSSFATLPGCTVSRQLLLALGSLNLTTPTPIQRECIPIAMMGKDIVASSATGSGKTVAFWVGVLERLLHRDRRNPMTRVVVITPTRELAVQVHGVGKALARYTDVQFCLCVGGLSLKVQEAELKQRPDVVVSTPGRLIDHVRNTPCFTMDGVEVLVLDEADRMLEEGFRAELEEIITAAPRSRQTLLFSATVTESVAQLTRLSMNKPVRVKIDEMGATARGLVQEFLRVRGDKPGEAIERGFRSGERSREALLVALCTRSFASGRTIIFFRSKAQAHRMKIIFTLFGHGLERSDELHGDLTQEQRLTSLQRFREGESSFLLATDLASRGLDIKGIENVVNYEMPKSIEIYLHRVGRTARAGKQGRALTLVGESDRKLVKLAMKHAPPDSIKQRTIPVDVHSQVTTQLKALESEVKAVQREEQEEKEMRRGDMELAKGRNLIEHEQEIKARPARTWFQTTQEKNIAKSAGLAEHNGKFVDRKPNENNKRPAPEDDRPPPPKRTPFSGLSRKEKRRKMAAMEDAEDEEFGLKKKIEGSIRSAKKAALPRKMTVAAPERDKGFTAKKSKKKRGGGFDRELGVAGRFEREQAQGGGGGRTKAEDSPRRGGSSSTRGRGARGGRGRGGRKSF